MNKIVEPTLALLLLLLFQQSKEATSVERTIVPFSYGWRFHYGDDHSSPPGDGPGGCNDAFDVNLANVGVCQNMERNPNRFSPKDCKIACCYDPTCLAWQAYPIALGRQCFHYYNRSDSKSLECPPLRPGNLSGLQGGRRDRTPNPAFRTDYYFASDSTKDFDRNWSLIDIPHDFIASRANFTNDITNFKQGYLPRNASWYRKHFTLPEEWARDGGETYVRFEGAFHHSTVFLNGEYLLQHGSGYTPFTVRLDNSSKIRFGTEDNVLAIRTDASFGSGHWYEGGGLYRDVNLIHVPKIHVVFDGLFVPSNQSTGDVIIPSVEIEGVSSGVHVQFSLLDSSNSVIASNKSNELNLTKENTIFEDLILSASNINLWSIQTPNLYTVRVEVFSNDGDDVDTVEAKVGFRTWCSSATSVTSLKYHCITHVFENIFNRIPQILRVSLSSNVTKYSPRASRSNTGTIDFDAESFRLNGHRLKLRGFSHHNSFGGLGVSIPDRLWLFRLQMSVALGSNFFRMSHNPYRSSVYDMLDAMGVMSWDENRDYGAKYSNGAYVDAMRTMVKHHRNHASIVIYSFCNEYECQQEDPSYSAAKYRDAARSCDTSRPVTANDATFGAPSYLDVQGFSHSKNKTFETFHQNTPSQPTILSECCSCESDRLKNRNLTSCIADQNSPGIQETFVSGSIGVWTLMDYFGEPAGTGTSSWPVVSSDFGQFDISGFPKPHAWWYTSNWLEGFDVKPLERPPLPHRHVVRIMTLPNQNDVTCICTAPFVELLRNGESVSGCTKSSRDGFGYASSQTFWNVPSFRNLTLLGLSDCGKNRTILGRDTILNSSSSSYRLQLSLDVPSLDTGTGTHLVLDGKDMAMIRATIVNVENSALVSSATNRIEFKVRSGPGMYSGCSNGDSSSHEWMKSNSINAHGGLAHFFVRVSVDCTSPNLGLAREIDLERSAVQTYDDEKNCSSVASTLIQIEASADDIDGIATLTIPVTLDTELHAPLSIAQNHLSSNNGLGYLDRFRG